MSVSSIGNSPSANSAPKVAAAAAFKAAAGTTVSGAAAAAAEEATETRATTQKEAQNGDQVAIRKVRQQEQAKARQAARAEPKSREPGKGQSVDHHA